ncbi:DUF3301 domain-containing protein [Marinomonas sp. 2405UD68-3]|uniref:DUF3301 domain-containing protein n=1 Tax=Marinomonas sp. 2405UD68-3 TaxID=3391835 RepID=UPI0039C96D85
MHIELVDILLLIALGLAGYLWWDANAVRERAFYHVKAHCKKYDVQLLDQSVALNKWRVIWSQGQFKLRRQYQFEFTSTGEARYTGNAVLESHTIISIELSAHHI